LSYARVESTIAPPLKLSGVRWLATRTVRALSITTDEAGSGSVVIGLKGEVDLYSCPELKQELLRVIADGATFVVVDLSETSFIDSTGLGVLIRGVERLQTEGGRLAVVSTDPNMTKVFEVTGLDRVFTIYSSRDEALAQVPS
jgi:anti-sigma B factor antagonist